MSRSIIQVKHRHKAEAECLFADIVFEFDLLDAEQAKTKSSEP